MRRFLLIALIALSVGVAGCSVGNSEAESSRASESRGESREAMERATGRAYLKGWNRGVEFGYAKAMGQFGSGP